MMRRITITTVNMAATLAHFKSRGMKMDEDIIERGNSLVEYDVNGLGFVTFLPETIEAHNLPKKDLPFYDIIWDSDEPAARPMFEVTPGGFQECGWI